MRTAHERHEIGSAVARSDAANEHPVLAAQGHLLHQLLGLVVVDRHEAVIEVDEGVVELTPQVGQRLYEEFLGYHVHHRFAGKILRICSQIGHHSACRETQTPHPDPLT